MAHLFSYPTKHGPRLIDICRAAVCRERNGASGRILRCGFSSAKASLTTR